MIVTMKRMRLSACRWREAGWACERPISVMVLRRMPAVREVERLREQPHADGQSSSIVSFRERTSDPGVCHEN